MKKHQIAAQLYTLRDYLRTPAGFGRAMEKLRKIGFEAVQVSGIGPIAPEAVRRMTDANGLTICATHESPDALFGEPEKIADKLDIYNCQHTAYPCPPESIIIDYEAVVELAQTLNATAEVFARRGKTLSYHNHNLEFRKVNGQRVLDVIYEHAPQLKVEIDTYWVQMGGCDPTEYIARFPNRQPLLHLKEFGVVYPRESIMVPIGSGNLNWPKIIAAARQADVQWYIIEQDRCQKDPFESLAESFHYLTENF